MASSIDRKWKHDVFISFRGEDTRNNFSGHLYASLERSGINTFKDDVKLQKGEEISPTLLTAIEDSRFAIVILSKNYASSTWCLKELVKIIECKSKGQTVYPIFYDVDTSEVRNQEGNFGVALADHERRVKPNLTEVQDWKSALNAVANLSGWDTKTDRNEPDLIQKIVERISKQKLSRTKISVAKHPVGIQSHVQTISSLMDINSKEVRKVGIYGCKGIGKTTIAKAIYNWHASQFDRCCFLMDVRDRSKDQYQIVKLQKLLLHEILGENMEFDNMDKGSTVIEERLRHKKVLIVIDGVEATDLNTLDKLAEKLDWFGPGSRIIITTTDKHLLETQDVHPTYEVKIMGQIDAIQLFSWYAFKKNKPEVDYMKLVNVAVRYSKGLPSALVKLGSDLYSRSKDYWGNKLLKNKAIEGENHNDIWIRLNALVETPYNDETREMHPSLLQLFKGALESPSNEHPNFNMNELDQCDDVDWKDDNFDLQAIESAEEDDEPGEDDGVVGKGGNDSPCYGEPGDGGVAEQGGSHSPYDNEREDDEDTSHPDADRTRVDETNKQGMNAWKGHNENAYAEQTEDVEKGEQWRNALQGGGKTSSSGELGDDDGASQDGNNDEHDDGASQGGSNAEETPDVEKGEQWKNASQGGSKTSYSGELEDDDGASQDGNNDEHDDGASQGGSKTSYSGELGDDDGASQDGNNDEHDDEGEDKSRYVEREDYRED